MTDHLPPPETLLLSDDGRFPNNRHPVLIYRGVPLNDLRQTLERNDWPTAWVDGIYDYHHYHSTAHELLVVLEGDARVLLGGEKGEELSLEAGLAVILPAGVAHKKLSASAEFSVLGAYPCGQSFDLLRGREGERPAADERIARVPLPSKDPFGVPGGLTKLWTPTDI